MYFDFEDHRPDITPVGRAISWREGVLISIIFHMAGVIALLTLPQWVIERVVPPPRAELSDENRRARAPERAENPTNPLPMSRGNSAERAERLAEERARGRG